MPSTSTAPSSHGAATQAALGSTESLDVRRAKALGDLARTQTALDLHTSGAGTARGTDGLPAAREVVLHAHLDATLSGDTTAFASDRAARGRPTAGPARPDQVVVCRLAHQGDDQARHRPQRRAVDTDAYAVPDRIREQVVLRDTTCVFPRCTRPARGCDIDHVIAHDPDAEAEGRPQPGPTADRQPRRAVPLPPPAQDALGLALPGGRPRRLRVDRHPTATATAATDTAPQHSTHRIRLTAYAFRDHADHDPAPHPATHPVAGPQARPGARSGAPPGDRLGRRGRRWPSGRASPSGRGWRRLSVLPPDHQTGPLDPFVRHTWLGTRSRAHGRGRCRAARPAVTEVVVELAGGHASRHTRTSHYLVVAARCSWSHVDRLAEALELACSTRTGSPSTGSGGSPDGGLGPPDQGRAVTAVAGSCRGDRASRSRARRRRSRRGRRPSRPGG